MNHFVYFLRKIVKLNSAYNCFLTYSWYYFFPYEEFLDVSIFLNSECCKLRVHFYINSYLCFQHCDILKNYCELNQKINFVSTRFTYANIRYDVLLFLKTKQFDWQNL